MKSCLCTTKCDCPKLRLIKTVRLSPATFTDGFTIQKGNNAYVELLSQVDSFEGGCGIQWNDIGVTADYLASGKHAYPIPPGANTFTVFNNHVSATRTIKVWGL